MRILLISLVSVSACMLAQDNPLSTSIKMEYGIAKNAITRSADKVPETDYGFKPTDDVRSFGQLVGHVADAQFSFCSAALGEKSPATGSFEKSIVRPSMRGGVPVLSRPTGKASSRKRAASESAAGSPARPAVYLSSPTWTNPPRKVPAVSTTAEASKRRPIAVTAPTTRPPATKRSSTAC